MFPCKGDELFRLAYPNITDDELEKFKVFAGLLEEKNKVMNLTAITDADEVTVKHFIDSLSCYDERFFFPGAKVLDLGTGAGFPGIPLAIMHDDLKITFFDSLQKRLTFLKEVTTTLSYKQAEFLHGRAEEEAHKDIYREAFDIVTTRAVARLPVLVEWALPYVKTGGYFVALKGAAYAEEIEESKNALKILGGMVEVVEPKKLPGLEDKRAVLYIKKVKNSPVKYPRKPKVAVKNPL